MVTLNFTLFCNRKLQSWIRSKDISILNATRCVKLDNFFFTFVKISTENWSRVQYLLMQQEIMKKRRLAFYAVYNQTKKTKIGKKFENNESVQ